MRNEYPRPELVRENWLNLNGEWDFEFDFGDTLEGKLPLKGRENLPTMGLLICTVESEEHGKKIDISLT